MTDEAPAGAAWQVIVLAGDRGPADPVAAATGAPCKALAPVGGRPLLARVLDTIHTSGRFTEGRIVGPSAELVADNPALAAVLDRSALTWIAPGASPVASVLAGLDTLDADQPVLVTTADHALLTKDMINAVCSAPRGLDLGVALVERARVRQAFPGSRRTAIRLGGEGYCGCNLFALYTPRARRLVDRWRRVENERKHPARVIAGMLGTGALVRYALRRLTLEAAFERLSARHDVRVGPVMLDDPRAAVDVDSVRDLHDVESILRGTG